MSRAKNSPGYDTLGKVFKEAIYDPVNTKNCIENSEKMPVMMKNEEALALKVQCNLSDNQYQMIRNAAKKQHANIFPPLHHIQTVKPNCYPNDTVVTETSAHCSLQSLVDHTASRIIQMPGPNGKLSDIIRSSDQSATCSGTFYFKAGMDGASSQSVYNQKFEHTNLSEGIKNEESLFQSALVPLKFLVNECEVWKNPKPSSSHFCRPLNLQYKKETAEVLRDEEARKRDEIANLKNLEVTIELPNSCNPINASIRQNIDITMLDGKAVNALTDTKSSQNCNLCGAKPSEMNNLEVIRSKFVHQDSLRLGLSSLHCWLRSFEYILHLGYKMENKKFQAKTTAEKESVAKRKMEIRQQFREKLNLMVDMPKQGFGNSNTGNTARRAFEQAETFAQITGVKEILIVRMRHILKAVCSGYDLEIREFKNYCLETSNLIVDLYGW